MKRTLEKEREGDQIFYSDLKAFYKAIEKAEAARKRRQSHPSIIWGDDLMWSSSYGLRPITKRK
jgi:hypothetical protein